MITSSDEAAAKIEAKSHDVSFTNAERWRLMSIVLDKLDDWDHAVTSRRWPGTRDRGPEDAKQGMELQSIYDKLRKVEFTCPKSLHCVASGPGKVCKTELAWRYFEAGGTKRRALVCDSHWLAYQYYHGINKRADGILEQVWDEANPSPFVDALNGFKNCGWPPKE